MPSSSSAPEAGTAAAAATRASGASADAEADADRVRVVVRLRPALAPAEGSRSQRWKLLHDEASAMVCLPSDGSTSMRKFSADAVCGPAAGQEAVYAHVRSCSAVALQGGRSSLLCYGASGAGKSYTLLGMNIGEWGVAPRAVGDICAEIERRAAAGNGGGHAEMACLLLYDETITDVLRRYPGPAAAPAAAPAARVDEIPLPAADTVGAQTPGSPGSSGADALTPATALDSASWSPFRTKREGMLLLQRCLSGRAAHLRSLSAPPSAIHTLLVMRTPPPDGASPDGAASSSSASSGGGTLCLVELVAASADDEGGVSLRDAPLPDASLDGFGRCLAAMGVASRATTPAAAAQHNVGSPSSPSMVDVSEAPPFFESVLTSLLHQHGLLQRGAHVCLLACIAPGGASAAATLSTLLMVATAMRARLVPPEPTSPRGLAALVAELRGQLAHTAATAATAAAFQAAERERIERENVALSSQLRTQLAAEAAWRDERAEDRRRAEAAEARAEAAEAAVAALRASGGGPEATMAEFAREARVLGLLYRQEGKLDAALRLQQRARKLHERAHGPKHHEVGRDLAHIGNCLCSLGRFDDAAAAYRDAHTIDTAAFGPEHAHTATDAASIGLVLATQKRWKEAAPHLEAAHAVLSAAVEPGHPNLVATAKFLDECRERLQSGEGGQQGAPRDGRAARDEGRGGAALAPAAPGPS